MHKPAFAPARLKHPNTGNPANPEQLETLEKSDAKLGNEPEGVYYDTTISCSTYLTVSFLSLTNTNTNPETPITFFLFPFSALFLLFPPLSPFFILSIPSSYYPLVIPLHFPVWPSSLFTRLVFPCCVGRHPPKKNLKLAILLYLLKYT